MTNSSGEFGKLDEILRLYASAAEPTAAQQAAAATIAARSRAEDASSLPVNKLLAAMDDGLRAKLLLYPTDIPVEEFLLKEADDSLLASLGLKPDVQSAPVATPKSNRNWLASLRDAFNAKWLVGGGMAAAALALAVFVQQPSGEFTTDTYVASNAGALLPLIANYPTTAPGLIAENTALSPTLRDSITAGASFIDVQILLSAEVKTPQQPAVKRLNKSIERRGGPSGLLAALDANNLRKAADFFAKPPETSAGFDLGQWARKTHLASLLRLQGADLPATLTRNPSAAERIEKLRTAGAGNTELYAKVKQIDELLRRDTDPQAEGLAFDELEKLQRLAEQLIIEARF